MIRRCEREACGDENEEKVGIALANPGCRYVGISRDGAWQKSRIQRSKARCGHHADVIG